MKSSYKKLLIIISLLIISMYLSYFSFNKNFTIVSMKQLYDYSKDEYYQRRSQSNVQDVDYLVEGIGTTKNKCLFIKSWMNSHNDQLANTNNKINNYRFFESSFSLRDSYGQEDPDYFSFMDELLLSFVDSKKDLTNLVTFNEGKCVDKHYIESKK